MLAHPVARKKMRKGAVHSLSEWYDLTGDGSGCGLTRNSGGTRRGVRSRKYPGISSVCEPFSSIPVAKRRLWAAYLDSELSLISDAHIKG